MILSLLNLLRAKSLRLFSSSISKDTYCGPIFTKTTITAKQQLLQNNNDCKKIITA